jgi:hypothetical protein
MDEAVKGEGGKTFRFITRFGVTVQNTLAISSAHWQNKGSTNHY